MVPMGSNYPNTAADQGRRLTEITGTELTNGEYFNPLRRRGIVSEVPFILSKGDPAGRPVVINVGTRRSSSRKEGVEWNRPASVKVFKISKFNSFRSSNRYEMASLQTPFQTTLVPSVSQFGTTGPLLETLEKEKL
jgi:hypothetical protein